jgi:hypothetical protein
MLSGAILMRKFIYWLFVIFTAFFEVCCLATTLVGCQDQTSWTLTTVTPVPIISEIPVIEVPTATQPPPAPSPTYPMREVTIVWDSDTFQYAALLAWTEAGPLGLDGMLSVISTAVRRYQDARWCERIWCSHTLLEEMQRPGQYTGPETWLGGPAQKFDHIDYSELPLAAFAAVTVYKEGKRGSCDEYEFFNSDFGGPADCKIVSKDGKFFIDFFDLGD